MFKFGKDGLGLVLFAILYSTGANSAIEPDEIKAAGQPPDSHHVLFVNVDQALDAEYFTATVDYVRLQVNMRIETRTIDESDVNNLVSNPGAVTAQFGENAAIVVMLENQENTYRYLQAPRSWSMVNLHGFDRDQPDAQTRQMRLKKLFLKGLVHAAGGGHNPDPRCVMWDGSHTLEGMDQTSATLGPYAFFSLQDTLRALGVQLMLPPSPQREP